MSTNWNETASFIEKVLNIVSPCLDKEAIDAVRHYLSHDEYEMAFEGLYIEIMKLPTSPNIDWVKSREIAMSLNLDKETFFDHSFWERFNLFLLENQQ